jgi:ribosomal protein L37AE/L43A
VLEARCPQCNKKAVVDDEMSIVTCSHCGFTSSYDDYIETMKGKALTLSDEFQMSSDKNPF